MRIRSDGSIQSSGTPTPDNVAQSEDFAIYRCIVDRVVYVGDSSNYTTNSSNPRVLYDLVVLGGFKSGQKLTSVRLSSDLGGESGFYERILRACTNPISGSRLSDSDGDIVLVQFIQGNIAFPLITGMDNGIHTSSLIGAKLAEGPRSLREYNGVRETIDNAGQWKQEVKSGVATPEKGNFAAALVPLVTTLISKDEKVTRTFKTGLQLTEDGPEDKITNTFKTGLMVIQDGTNDKITETFKNGLTITEDGSADKITASFKNGLVVTQDGVADKVTIAFSHGLRVVEDGTADKLTITTAGGATVTINGAGDDILLKTAGGAELHLNAGKVALGQGAVEILDKLSKVADLVSQWATNVGAVHTHLGNLGYPSDIPDNFALYLQLGTDEATQKTEVDSIKGTL